MGYIVYRKPTKTFTLKNLLFILLFLAALKSNGQNTNPGFDGAKWQAPYKLNVPQGWDVERFLIPIDFAPTIPYKGVEDIRFTPGWGDVKTDEYWSYAFLWYLDDKQEMDEKIIEDNLKAYYTGLVGRNIEPRKIPAEKLMPVKASIKLSGTFDADLKTFTGTIDMLDYMQQKPITLHCIVHLKSCEGENKTYVFNEISPQPFTAPIWETLNHLWTEFSCK